MSRRADSFIWIKAWSLAGSNSTRSANESLSLATPRSDHRKARHSGLICKYVVAEKTAFPQVIRIDLPDGRNLSPSHR
jgi:hypothetical protein